MGGICWCMFVILFVVYVVIFIWFLNDMVLFLLRVLFGDCWLVDWYLLGVSVFCICCCVFIVLFDLIRRLCFCLFVFVLICLLFLVLDCVCVLF